MSTIRLNVLSAVALLAVPGLASAQSPYPGVPQSTYTPPSYTPLPSYTAPSLVPVNGQGLSQSDAQQLLIALNTMRSGDGARIRSAMDGLYDPLARRIALWAQAAAVQ